MTHEQFLDDATPIITFEQVQAEVATTATYEQSVHPETILRRGLIEEVGEFYFEATNPAGLDSSATEMELGDLIWYVSEISRYHGLVTAEIVGDHGLLDDIVVEENAVAPIVNGEGELLALDERPESALIITALRVVDVMDPKLDFLWYGLRERISLTEALHDLCIVTKCMADRFGMKLSDAILRKIDLLRSRERTPHVIEESRGTELGFSSGRHRLIGLDPWVRKLVFDVSETQPE